MSFKRTLQISLLALLSLGCLAFCSALTSRFSISDKTTDIASPNNQFTIRVRENVTSGIMVTSTSCEITAALTQTPLSPPLPVFFKTDSCGYTPAFSWKSNDTVEVYIDRFLYIDTALAQIGDIKIIYNFPAPLKNQIIELIAKNVEHETELKSNIASGNSGRLKPEDLKLMLQITERSRHAKEEFLSLIRTQDDIPKILSKSPSGD